MMLNIHSIFRATIQGIEDMVNNCNILKDKLNVQKLKNVLIIKIDQILKDILTNLADYYPQAPSTGGNTRLK